MITPKAAPIESRFITMALIGTTSEPNAMASRTKVMPPTSSAIQGSRAASECSWSTTPALEPPTITSAPAGGVSARIWVTMLAGGRGAGIAGVVDGVQRRFAVLGGYHRVVHPGNRVDLRC